MENNLLSGISIFLMNLLLRQSEFPLNNSVFMLRCVKFLNILIGYYTNRTPGTCDATWNIIVVPRFIPGVVGIAWDEPSLPFLQCLIPNFQNYFWTNTKLCISSFNITCLQLERYHTISKTWPRKNENKIMKKNFSNTHSITQVNK